MAILVTGTPGSGKTTLTQYAKSVNDKRFFDADEISKLCEWREFETGKVLGYVTEQKETDLDEWYKKYGWYWRQDAMNDFLTKTPQAILCGSAENIVDFYPSFDRIIILKKTIDELLNNLASSDRNNPFGKTPDQRKNFMNWQEYLIKEAEKFHPIIIEGNDTSSAYKTICNMVSK
jgi:broad-specificity NMP kinase